MAVLAQFSLAGSSKARNRREEEWHGRRGRNITVYLYTTSCRNRAAKLRTASNTVTYRKHFGKLST
eukprot:3358385-Pyramimonas_sp.AAC.1